MYTSDFETGCNVLWRLGVAHAAYGPEPGRKGLTVQTIVNENIFPPHFKFFPPAEISGLFSGDPPASSPSLREVLCAYLRVACDYGPQDRGYPQNESLSSRNMNTRAKLMPWKAWAT
jgi:hypothetical protein